MQRQLATNQSEKIIFPWENLVAQIQDEKIIPVIGQDLYALDNNRSLYLELAAFLNSDIAEKYKGDKHVFQKTVFDYLYPVDGKKRSYSNLKSEIENFFLLKKPSPSQCLIKLARIRKFKIYINTTYDNLLEKALYTVGRQVITHHYTPNEKDLEGLVDCMAKLDNPNTVLLFNVFGNLKKNNKPAYTENDIIESISSLQTDNQINPNKFFNTLKRSNFLFIGCSYKNWLLRFLIRSISNNPFRLWDSDEQQKFFSSNISTDIDDLDLRIFLESHSSNTEFPDKKIYFEGNTDEFNRKLWNQIEKEEWIIPEGDFRKNVFVSFHGDDRSCALSVNNFLEKEKGFKTWFDSEGSRIGNNVDESIRQGIRSSDVFLVIITNNYVKKLGYVERELNYVRDRNAGLAKDNRIRIFPIVIGEIDKKDVPPEAMENFWVKIDSCDLSKDSVKEKLDELSRKLGEICK